MRSHKPVKLASSILIAISLALSFSCKPRGLSPSPAPIAASSAAPETAVPTDAELIFSEGNLFPAYGADVLEKYDEIVLEFPKGNPYDESGEHPLAAKLLLPKGWTVTNGMFEGIGYYPIEEFVSYCIAARPGNDVMSVFNENGECVGAVGLVATTSEYPGIDQAFASVSSGNGSFRFFDESESKKVNSGANGEAYTGLAHYTQKLAVPDERLNLSLPVFIAYDSEFFVGLVTEFADGAVTDEQLTEIAESVRFARLSK